MSEEKYQSASELRDGPGRADPVARGYARGGISNVGGMFVILKPFEERAGKPGLSGPEVVARLRSRPVVMPGAIPG